MATRSPKAPKKFKRTPAKVKTVTPRQWAKFLPARKVAAMLRQISRAIDATAKADVRYTIKVNLVAARRVS